MTVAGAQWRLRDRVENLERRKIRPPNWKRRNPVAPNLPTPLSGCIVPNYAYRVLPIPQPGCPDGAQG